MVHDDKTNWGGATWLPEAGDWSSHIIEPGYMKVVIENDWTSYDLLSGDIKIEAKETEEVIEPDITITREIDQDEWIGWIPIVVPKRTKNVIIELWWVNDWSVYPTTDLDVYIYWDKGYDYRGATMNAPERVVLDQPTVLYVLLHGYAIYTEIPEPFELTIRFVK